MIVPLPMTFPLFVQSTTFIHVSDQIAWMQDATRPFSRMNRARTTNLLMVREQRSRLEVEKAQSASLDERGIDETLTQEMRGLNVGTHSYSFCTRLCGIVWSKEKIYTGSSINVANCRRAY